MIYAIRPVLLGVLMGMFYIACSYAPKADSQEQRIEASCVPVQFGNHYASGQMCDMPNGDRCYVTLGSGGGGLSCIPANNSLRPPDDDGVSSESQGTSLHVNVKENLQSPQVLSWSGLNLSHQVQNDPSQRNSGL